MKITIKRLDKLRDAMLEGDGFAFMRRTCKDCGLTYLNGEQHKCPQIVDAVFVDVVPR